MHGSAITPLSLATSADTKCSIDHDDVQMRLVRSRSGRSGLVQNTDDDRRR